MHRSIAVSDQDRIVIGDRFRIRVRQFQRERVFRFRPRHVDDFFGIAPGHSIVGGTSQKNINIIPVAPVILPRFAPGEDGSLRRDDNTGNVKPLVTEVADFEQVDLFDERFRSSQGIGNPRQKTEGETDEFFHGVCFRLKFAAFSKTVLNILAEECTSFIDGSQDLVA